MASPWPETSIAIEKALVKWGGGDSAAGTNNYASAASFVMKELSERGLIVFGPKDEPKTISELTVNLSLNTAKFCDDLDRVATLLRGMK